MSDGETGEIQALFDSETLTSRSTAAVAALGASFLAPPDADHMLLVGAGRVAQEFPPPLPPFAR